MQSRRTYIPSHILWKSPAVRQRVACDALARGILFPPEPETLPGVPQPASSRQAHRHRVGDLRPVISGYC